MKKPYILILFSLFLYLGFASAICGSGLGQTQTDSTSSNKTGSATYLISRYVIGSGGITRAVSTNHIHSATAGETFVGGMQGANNFLISGFWLSPGFGPTGVDQKEAVGLPTAFELYQSYPNPFNPQTTIAYDLPKACQVTVEIFNAVGQRICVASSQLQGPGHAQAVWDARDEQGKPMGSGVYLYRVTASAANAGGSKSEILFQQSKKMLLVR